MFDFRRSRPPSHYTAAEIRVIAYYELGERVEAVVWAAYEFATCRRDLLAAEKVLADSEEALEEIQWMGEDGIAPVHRDRLKKQLLDARAKLKGKDGRHASAVEEFVRLAGGRGASELLLEEIELADYKPERDDLRAALFRGAGEEPDIPA